MTAKSAVPTLYLGISDIATRLGIPRGTVMSWHERDKLPPADAMIGDRKGWLPNDRQMGALCFAPLLTPLIHPNVTKKRL